MPKHYIPLHPAQQDVYMDQLLNTESPEYNIGGYIVLKGNLNKGKFHEAVNSAPAIFDSFKMRFDLQAQDLLCHYDDDYNTTPLIELDFSDRHDAVQAAKEWMGIRFNTPFLLNKESLPFEQYLIKINEKEHWYFGKYHHLITDGYGFIIYVQYVAGKYTALLTGDDHPFNHPRYEEAAVNANTYYQSADYQEDGNYWKEKIPVKPEKLLQKKYASKDIKGKTATTYSLNLTGEQRSQLEAIQIAANAGLQQLTIAALLIYFGEISATTEFVFGTPIHKRGSRQLRNTVGMFSGILPFTGTYNKEQILAEFLKEISGSQRRDYRHQNYLIGDLSRDLKVNASDGYLCEVLVNYEPLGFELNFGDEIKASIVRLANEDERNPLQLCWRDYGKEQSLQLQIQFRHEYFTAEEIELLAQRVLFIIKQFPDALDKSIETINILQPQERELLLVDFNTSQVDYPKDKSIVDVFEEQVIKNPDATAVVFEGSQLTYKELNERSNQLGRYLQKQGVKAGTMVPICVERSLEMIVGVLGILKAGGAYVPIDPEYPADRISFMLEDTKAEVLLSSKLTGRRLAEITSAQVIELDGDWEKISNEKTGNLGAVIHPAQLAYVIYTSGSTGRPKGVMIENRTLLDHCFGMIKSADLSICNSFGLFSPLVFDAGHSILWSSMFLGRALHVISDKALLDPEWLAASLKRSDIDCIKIVPSLWNYYADANVPILSNKVMVFGGEGFTPNIFESLIKLKYGGVAYNHYGPTEATIGKSIYKIDLNKTYKTVPIGKPFSNTSIYIVNNSGSLVPVGVTGEICIGGAGLARGYLNRPELTAEKFIHDPFSKHAGARLYKTGDLGKWLPDGNIEHLGRIDDQVKIHGFRIELGEIESTLNGCEWVRQAAVLAKEDSKGNKRLVGYIVPEGEFDRQAIQAYLHSKLPEYMVPALWVEIESIPLTSNGKINRKALPDFDLTDTITEYVAPRNETEQVLANIWQAALGAELVGVYTNFFELGGHSLLAMRVASAIRRELNIEIGIKDIFVNPTIAALMGHLGLQNAGLTLPGIEAIQIRPEHIPLSFSQERLWFIDSLEGSIQYHVPAIIRLKGELNAAALENSLRTIIGRHEVLRTVILESTDGSGYQLVKPETNWSLIVEDRTKEDNSELEQHIERLVKAPFNLSSDYMLRANLFKIGKEDHILVIVLHHIASDGWSRSILVGELVELYASYVDQRPAKLPPLPIQYADYSIWQQKYLQGELLEDKLQYWKRKLDGVTTLELPTDYSRPAIQSSHGAKRQFSVDKSLSSGLQKLSQEQGATLYMTLLSAFNVLLYRYSGQEDICVGTPVSGRQQQEVEGLIGFFVNTLALRNTVSGKIEFAKLLQEIKAATLEAYGHQEVPFEKVVDAVVKERDLSRSPLFQVMFVFQNTPEVPELRLGNTALVLEEADYFASKYDLTLTLTETPGELSGSIQYNTDLYKADTIDGMIRHFINLLGSIISEPERQVGDLAMLDIEEKETLLYEFNDTDAEYPQGKNIVTLFGEQVIKNPGATAIVFGKEQLTYKELDERSNQLANYLRTKGVKAETLVPVCIERGLGMMVGILGILKAGAAYVPVDPEYPADRISYMLEDTAASIVISSKASSGKLGDTTTAQVVLLDENWDLIQKEKNTDPKVSVLPGQLAYMIYTSGSTGKPKGVMIEHRSAYAFISWCQTEFVNDHFDIGYATTSICFDLSVFELFYPLSAGKPIRILENGLAIGNFLAQDKNILINTVPSVIDSLINEKTDLSHVSVINMAGEPIPLRILEGLDTTRIAVRNLYGPTEDTTYSTICKLENGKPITIGKPISNTRIYILNDEKGLSPIGVTGEICIGGDGLARGYLNRAELTAEKFINNPFSNESGARLYKTGDIGRWLPDGNIAYLGRIDDQVKIRGYRIELGEIENVLNSSELVSQAVVLAKADSNGNKRLVGYVVPEGTFDKQAIQSYLNERLPEYMVPSLWVELDSIPLTPNGKTDKKALPDPELTDASVAYVAPRTITETALASIWQQLLGREQVGIYDNFFELGGHSLLAMRIVSAIRRELNVELAIKDLFVHPAIAGLGSYIDEQGKDSLLSTIIATARPEHIPLSFSQERLWFIDRLNGSVQYHLPAVITLKGALNNEVLENTLRDIISRHEALRTVILEDEDGLGYQQVMPVSGWSLLVEDRSKNSENTAALKQYINQLTKLSFDLSADFMLRANLIKVAEQEHALVITMHHIASDGWSTSILVKEVVEIYAAYEEGRQAQLSPLPLQYADYSIWQRSSLPDNVLEDRLKYWKQKLSGVSPLELPTDNVRPPVLGSAGANFDIRIDKKLSSQLRTLSQQNEATLYMTLLTAFKILLYRYSGQEDICVGTPIAGRQQHEVEGLIGFFVNTLALRSQVSGETSFTGLLKEIKTTTLEAYGHQDVPFEKVVDAIVRERDMSRNPLFQVMFALNNTPEVPELHFGQVEISLELPANTTTKFDLSLSLTEASDGIVGSVQYNTDLYNESTIALMITHFQELLGSIVINPAQHIGLLSMLTALEQRQLLVDFNATETAYPMDKSIVALFEEQAVRSPGSIAAVFEDKELTYKELNERSNQVAHYLGKHGIKVETLVPILIERSLDMLIGVLGILKSGAAYVPIDIEYPTERIKYMLADTAAELVLSNKANQDRLAAITSLDVIALDSDWDVIRKEANSNPNLEIRPGQLAYVIYTSGSTGTPKGVMIEHRSVVSLVMGVDYVSLDPGESLLVTGSPSFDATTFEYWSMLLNGGRLILYPEEKLLDSTLLGSAITNYQVTKMWFTSSWFNQLVDSDPEVFAGLKTILVGGEKLSEHHIEKVRKYYPNLQLINGYGPTENTTFSLTYPISDNPPANPIPIGRPLSNRQAHVLTKFGQLTPIGVTGEIYLGGAGVARGYLNRADLTSDKFISDPFSKDEGARLYRTGDLGKWLPDGNIEYTGRIDDQVKIRGFRIELGEIESILNGCELVQQGVVLAKEDQRGIKRLVGYVVPEGTFNKQAIQEYLQGRLPDYMVPALWVELDSIPLTPNGKTDKRSLPDPELTDMAVEYAAPRNETEQALAGIWQELLGLERVGIYDNFFELGGDSILTIQVVSRMRRLGHQLQPKDIFNHQVIAGLSAAIEKQRGHLVLGEQGLLKGTFPLLPIQDWYLEKADRDISHYNQSVLLKIDKSVTPTILQTILDQLMIRHDALRLIFDKNEGIWQQTYGTEQAQLLEEDLREFSQNSLEKQINDHAEEHQGGLSIEQGKLIRMVWMQTPASEKENRLLIVIHHLAVDGVSWRILLADIDQLLESVMNGKKATLETKSSSYRQWYNAISEYSQSGSLAIQKGYWNQAVNNYVALPEDKKYAGELRMKDLGHHQVKLGAELTRQLLQDVPKVYHTEINDLLLSALSASLCNWSGNSQVVIGLEGHGREAISAEIDTSNTVGWFTSLYPVLLKKGTDADFLIKGVKEELRSIPDKGLGYGVLKYVEKTKELQGAQPWDLVFNYLGQLDTAIVSSKWLSPATENSGSQISKEQPSASRLSVNSHIFGGELILNWGYSTLHYNPETINQLAAQYTRQLTQLINHCIEQGKKCPVYTPADYGLSSQISYQELDKFLEEPYLDSKIKDHIESISGLSGLQQGILFHSLYDDGGYIEQVCCDLISLDREVLFAAWAEVIKNHSILRSAFYYDSFSVPVQCVFSEVTLPVEELDYREMDLASQQSAIKAYEVANRATAFDFKSAPLMRLGLIRLTETRYRMVWTFHHILIDGWSLPILMEELLTSYELLGSGKSSPVIVEDRYEDYIHYLEQINKDAEERYWRKYLQEIDHGTLLPFVKSTADRTKGKGEYKSLNILLEGSEAKQVQEYAQLQRLTVNTLMQGIWGLLLHKYTGQSEVLFGVVVSGRPDDLAGVEHRVGMYINTLPLKARFDENQETVAWLQKLQAEQVASREYQYTALQDIQQWAGIRDDMFDSLLTFENYPVSKLLTSKNWSLEVANVQIEAYSNYPLTIIISSAEQLSISFNYNSEILDASYVEAIRDQFEKVLLQITSGAADSLSDISLLTPVQERQLLVEFNDVHVAYPKDKSVIDLFEEQAIRNPDGMAVVFEDQRLSYRALNERSNQLAHYLQSKGVTQNSLVPLLIERGCDMLVGMLGILKAGGAYVPIDTDFPMDRVSYMLEDTGAKVVVSSSESSEKLPFNTAVEIIELDEERATLKMQPSERPLNGPRPDHLAYVIYTSGSTGKPKGVQISHRNLVDYVYGLDNKVNIGDCKSFALVSSIATDLGNTVLYGSLLTGGALHVFSKEMVSHIESLHEYFEVNQIDCLKIVPSHWKALILDGQPLLPLKLLVFGGEALQGGVVEMIQNTGTSCRIVNHYGPTETTIGKLLYEVQATDQFDQTVPIGKPFSNTQIYVLSKELTLCPIGVQGQLFIAGDGVSRGYVNNDTLTAEKFIPNPFDKNGQSMMYGTGDRVVYRQDGNIVFIGRVDDQVKIRGYRVEPGEVGRILEESELVSQAIVLSREDKQGNNQLVGYIIPTGEYDRAGIQAYLKELLPDYMIPAHLVELSSFPLMANGKVDRRALPDPEGTIAEGGYVAPRNEKEAELAEIWQDVLELDEVGVTDDFFEIGGHSLLAVRLVSIIRRKFGVELPIADVFDYPTVSQLAARLTDEPTGELLPLVTAAERPEYIPLSFSQERLWFIDRLEGSAQYNQPSVLRLKGDLNLEILEKTLRSIIARHEVLRTIIREHEGQGYQQVMPADNWTLGITKAADNEGISEYIAKLVSKPFDFSNDYMLRADLIALGDQDHILVVTMHHIASDGWSRAILVKEVMTLYEAYASGTEAALTTLPVQYADYAIWQRKYMRGEILDEKLGYWKRKLEDVATLELPSDYSRPAIQRLRGAMLSFNIDKDLSSRVNTLGQQHGATLYMTLLAAFKVLLYRYSGQEDICVGTTVAGRNQQDLEGLIGFFINTLALRSQVRGDMPFSTLLEEVKGTTLEAYAHQEVPFEKVVDAVVNRRDMSRNPLFQVLFTLQNTPEIPELNIGGLTLSTEEKEHDTSRFDIAFMIREDGTGIRVALEYNTDLYNSERIGRMAVHFRELLQSVVDAPQTAIGDLEILSPEEKNELNAFGSSQSTYPEGATVAGIFEERALQTPDAIAVAYEEQQLSYRALNERSNQLAHYLRGKGVTEETLVPLLMERGIDMVVGILGILKAGGVYVPIDTDFPQDRVSYMLEDTVATVVVTSSASSYKIPTDTRLEIIELDEERAALRQQPSDTPATSLQPDNLAYVIYTSGSTGKPKGVEISHRNLVDYVFGLDDRTKISDCKSFALVSSIATDLGNTVLYGSLLTGGTLHLFSKEMVSHIEALHKYFEVHQIDCLKIVPSHWKVLTMDGQPLLPLKLLVFGGEALQSSVVEMIRATGTACRIVNHYGPTETTIGKLLHEVKAGYQYDQVIPIGRPFSNTRTYVLSSGMKSCPIGVPGQLFIAGEGVARGYLNRADLTAEKFVQEPGQAAGLRMYGTGDRVVYQQDGNIVFLGRVDDQVKIRGYRVEPGEVGRILEESDLVSQAIVLSREDKQGNNQLVGYVIPAGEYDRAGIHAYLKEHLPDYMIPAHLVELESFPLAANGKIDRKALPDPEGTITEEGYIAPRNEAEAKLAEIWQDVLELDEVGINDDFFEIGGHSLLAVRLVSAIRKTFGMELPIADVFDYPTVGLLATRLTGEQTTDLLPPVTAAERPAHIPLSFSQERLWFIDRLEGSVQYHVPAVIRLKGKLDRSALEKTFKHIISRHEVLRTVIVEDDGLGYQQIMPAGNWYLEINDKLSDHADLSKYISGLVNKPFDLSTDYMLRADLIKITEEDHILVVIMHHMASDGWSRSVLVKEVIALYEGFATGAEISLPALNVQYADYAIWQQNYLQGDVLENKISYWKKKLDNVATLQLPTDYSRPPIQGSRGSTRSFSINANLADQLNGLARQQGATLYMTLLSAFKVLLYRYSGQEDICVGTSVAGRNQQELEELIGFFINTIALRSQCKAEMTFIELLQDVKATTLEAYAHQEVPFEKVVDAVVKGRDMSRSPLFQVMFTLQNTPDIPELKLSDLRLSAENQEHTTSKFDIAFIIKETSAGVEGAVEYSTDLYKEETIDRMIGHYVGLLESIVASPSVQAGSLRMLTAAEETALLREFNNTAAVYPKEKSVVTLFEEQVAMNPDALAIVFDHTELTYRQLNERANQLARYLQKQGVKAETLVPICLARSVEMMIGILGILKAGGAYVPIDPEYPQDRINYMLEDTAAMLVLGSKSSQEKVSGGAAKVIVLDEDLEVVEKEKNSNPETEINPDQLAYIIYTSGSTGKPKGVMIEHQSLVNYLCNNNTRYINDNQENNAGSFIHLSYSFDASLTGMFMPLLSGKYIVIGSSGSLDVFTDKNFEKYAPYDFIKITPSHIGLLPTSFKGTNGGWLTGKLVLGGEALRLNQFDNFVEEGIDVEIINEYGPTEATVGCSTHSFFTLGADQFTQNEVPIGKPISNTYMYILSADKALSPIGVTGEIYIGGDGLARGYLKRPELTAEKFIKDPFTEKAGARLYRTGDLGSWLPDGSIKYQGRVDDQVKIRGYRIELGEIESVLNESEFVSQGVVLAKADKHDVKRLVSYIVPEGAFQKQAIQAYLYAKLPDYMVPALWVEMESLPLTSNGKIDKKALPDPELSDISVTYVAPVTKTALALADIWMNLLGVKQVGIYDNFFELGGHSLLAMRVVSAIRKKLNIEVSIRDLFVHPDINRLGTYLDEQINGSLIPAITAGDRPEYIPLSFSQERLWFIDNLQGSTNYHIPAVIRLKGAVNFQVLERTLRTIVDRHEVLRTVILKDESGVGYQQIVSASGWSLTYESTIEDETPVELHIEQLVKAPFDLSADYMLRATLVKIGEDEHLLVVTMHHIVSDGWSTSILVKEVVEIYQANIEKRAVQLPELSIQYADYAIWQRNYLQGEVLENKIVYWKEKLEDISPLQLPTDYNRPPVPSSHGGSQNFSIDQELSAQLVNLSQQQGSTVYMTILAAYKVLLFRYSGQEDICVGTPIAGRTHQELEQLIGFFINTLALRSQVKGDMSFSELLGEVKETTLEAYAHQEVPYEKVVDAVVKERNMNRSPLFQVTFTFQNTPEIPELKLGDLALNVEVQEQTTAKQDISLYITQRATGMTGRVEYSTDLYKKETIERMINHFINLLGSIVVSPENQIGCLSMLQGEEEHRLLVDFNDSAAAYPTDKSIINMFEEEVVRNPGAMAVVFEDQALSYEELNKKSNQLAHYLRKQGVKLETLVPICVERSPEMIIGILGILKAGGAYVPIDPAYPEDRISYMLEDTGAELILSSRSCRSKVGAMVDIIELDGDWEQINNEVAANPDVKILPGNLAYVIYTSGSTGKPKGVMIEHTGVVNLGLSQAFALRLEAGMRTLQFASFGFDASCYEIFNTFLSGGCLVLCNKEDLLSVQKFSELVNKHKIEVAVLPPSFQLTIDNDTLGKLKTIVSAGEALNETTGRHIQSKGIRLINAYGPTETTVCASLSDDPIRPDNVVTIGKPIRNDKIYILSEKLQLSPVGVTGELCVGGAGLARGYLNRPELTSEKFIADPFSNETGARLYKTGDLGRWLPDGNIEYLGRIDDQVKIRGYRIELGEIESVLNQSDLVDQAIVLAKADSNGNKRLVAYVVASPSFSKDAIQEYLSSKLPDYMVPGLWIELSRFPLTASGKIDRKGLPDPEGSVHEGGYVAPRNETEAAIALIWQDLLEIDQVGMYDDFFELGGHSLLAVRVISYIQRELSVNIPIHMLFQFTTINDLSKYLELEIQANNKIQEGNTDVFKVIDV